MEFTHRKLKENLIKQGGLEGPDEVEGKIKLSPCFSFLFLPPIISLCNSNSSATPLPNQMNKNSDDTVTTKTTRKTLRAVYIGQYMWGQSRTWVMQVQCVNLCKLLGTLYLYFPSEKQK